ncbi:ABC transporter permease [Streptomyces apocyni]|uniref:ABC transporter permease n=1 Tax=Streptomyces apocyni TaxID=2654677 RepID=UPI0012E99DA6|nr:ABC transporter permease [Streptomyces apocyni]
MTTLSPPPTAPHESRAPTPPGLVGSWLRDLGIGLRFAVAGGREGWFRTLLTAVGVGLGVALLLVTTALPNALQGRHDREMDRSELRYGDTLDKAADDTLLFTRVDTEFRNQSVRGRMLQPEGPRAPVPPGLNALPKPGEMVVSPALRDLLTSSDGELLARRLDYDVVGTIADDGLVGPGELAYYVGADIPGASPENGADGRIDSFGEVRTDRPMGPVLVLLVVVMFVVLLMPVGVFIAAAVRFGGDRRDRRLAALRLVGADGQMVRRTAAGEAFAGALIGLLIGAGLFLAARQLAGQVRLDYVTVFSHDLDPSLLLVLLVAVTVPASAVAVTLFALRGVVIEPLGVVRTAKPSRRRLWWRLLLPVAGVGLLYPMFGQGDGNGDFNQWMVTCGVVLILIGITALLPWLVEACVNRLGGGGLSWQLAVRRLQLSSGTAARMVNGIAVAVAGAIALQMLFAGVEDDYVEPTGVDRSQAQMVVSPRGDSSATEGLAETDSRLRAADGVRRTMPHASTWVSAKPTSEDSEAQVTVGSCAVLGLMAKLPSCRDGDVFAVDGESRELAKPGTKLYFEPIWGSDDTEAPPWTVPASVRAATAVEDPMGNITGGLLVTTGALPQEATSTLRGEIYVQIDESVPDVREHVRNAAAMAGPYTRTYELQATQVDDDFRTVRKGLFIGATCVMLLIGVSLLVSQLEQLRERKKLLSALVAFGTRRRTLCLSVLWQTAVPIALGLVLATVVGITLGAVLLKMAAASIAVDWAGVAAMAGIGAGVVLLVTGLSLPPLLRLMRPDGLRTE